MAKYLKSNEFFVALTIILLSVVIGSRSSAYFTMANGIDTIRSVVVSGIFALGVYITIVSGGIDVSFPAIASLSMFGTTKLLISLNFNGPVIVVFIIGGLIGLLLGLLNGAIISYYKLPTLIVTLGTSSIYSGFCLAFLGAKSISNIPKSMDDFSKLNIFKFTTKEGVIVGLPSSLLILVLFTIIVFFIMNYTLLGRGIYALGGDSVSAERVGFNIRKTQFFVYGFVGL
ncbi:MAG: ABC transporter permease, partial [Ruminiclostridium sp.]